MSAPWAAKRDVTHRIIFSSLIAHPSPSSIPKREKDAVLIFERENGVCLLSRWDQLNQGTIAGWTEAQHLKAASESADCGIEHPIGSPPLDGLVQWLKGEDLVDQIGVLSAPTIVDGTITQTDPNLAYSSLWSTNGVDLVAVTPHEQKDWISGSGYVWIYTQAGIVEEVLTYDHVLSVEEYTLLCAYFQFGSNEILEILYADGDAVITTNEWNDEDIWYALLRATETSVVYVLPS